MSKKQKITTAMIAKAMGLADKTTTITCGLNEDAIVVPVKTHLTLSERAMMIADIVNMAFLEDEEGTKYCPAFREFAINYSIVKYFTDISLPSDSEKANNFLEASRLSEMIQNALPDGYIEEIIFDADDAVEFRKQEILKQNKIDKLIDKIHDVIKAFGNVMEGIDPSQIMEYVEKNAPELKDQLEELVSNQAEEETTA